MKKIGLIYDKNSKKLFLLPDAIKALTKIGIEIYITSGYGSILDISDADLASSGAKLLFNNKDVINSSQFILKVNAFEKNEIALCKNKIAITLANYVVNVEMLYEMLKNNVTGLAWSNIIGKNGYLFFQFLEELKAKEIVKLIKDAFAKGLNKKPKDKVTYPKQLNILILNASYNAVALTKQLLQLGHHVTLLDNDISYCKELKESAEIAKLCLANNTTFEFDNANYTTLVKRFKEANCFINTAIDPVSRTRTRITKEMAKTMPPGSVLYDAACENGYAFYFQKDFVSNKISYQNLEKFYWCCINDFSDLNPKEASKIISEGSLNFVLDPLGNRNVLANYITMCEKGKIVSPYLKTTLKLY